MNSSFPNFPFIPFPFMNGCANNHSTENSNSGKSAPQFPFMPFIPFMPFPFMPFMPFPFMNGSANNNSSENSDSGKSAPQFPFMPFMPFGKEMKFGGFDLRDVPVEILQTLLKIDATPEELEKLQKVLDFFFDLFTRKQTDANDFCTENNEVTE